MPVQAQLPDGTKLEFPSGTDPAVINRAVKEYLGVSQPEEASPPQPEPASPSEMPRNPAMMTPAEQRFPEATRPYEGPSIVGDRATTGSGDDSVLDALVKVGENTPEIFQRALGGAMLGLGERGQEAVAEPSTVAPAAAGLTRGDVLAVESEAARAQGKDVEQFRAERQEAAETAPLAESGRELFQEATQRLRKNAPEVEPGTAPYYTYMAGEAFVHMGPAVLATVATRRPDVGLTIMGGQVAADRYAEARERGLEPGPAAGEAAYYAATEALTEKIPLGVLASGGGNWAKRAFKSAVYEGFQEPVSEALQMGYEMGVLDEDLTPQDAARRLRDAGVIGFLAGGGLSVTTEPLIRLRERGEKLGPTDERAAVAEDAGGGVPVGEQVARGAGRPTEAPTAPPPEDVFTPDGDTFTPTAERHPYDDRLLDAGLQSGLRQLAEQTGYAEEGGKIIRDPETGEVTGRTPWMARDPELQEIVKGTEYAGDKGREKLRGLIERAITGEGRNLTDNQQNIIDAMTDLAEVRTLGYRGAAMDDETTREIKRAVMFGEPEGTATEDEVAFAGRDTENIATRSQRASAGEIPLDEVVPERRVAEMSNEEKQRALLESEIAGLLNRRAFIEARKKAARVAVDVDSLKWINDNAGHDAGNALLGAIGQAFREEGVEAYHISGDEFVAQADSREDAEAGMERVARRLQGATIRATMPDGQVIEVTPGISHGTAETLTEAERRLGEAKFAREQAGERAPRGERPPTVRDVEGAGREARVQPARRGDRGRAAQEKVEPSRLEAAPGRRHQGMLRESAPPEEPVIELSGGRLVEVPDQPIRRRDIIDSIQRQFGARIYSGRIKGKSMLGYHKKSSNEIRTKYKHDLEVTAHELAHWLDDRYPQFRETYRKTRFAEELKGVSYDSKRVNEGFAEFVRLYMTQETEARERAPLFFERFRELLGEIGIASEVNRIQEDMHAWYYQGARGRLASKMGAPLSIRQRLERATHRATDRFITQTLDGLYEIAVAEKDLTGEIADAVRSPYKSFRLVAGARGTIKSIFHYGTINWDGSGNIMFTGPSLESVFAPVSDNLENTKLYFIARRAQELKSQGRERLIEDDEINAGLAEGEKDPRIKKAFDDWLAFNKRMMDFYESSGIISKRSRRAMEEANKDYVPFHRIMEVLQGEDRTRIGAIHRLRGGTSNLGDIFENMEQSIATLTRMALINRAKKLAYDMVDKSKGGSYYAVKIPKESRAVQIEEQDIIDKVLPGFGLTPSEYKTYQRDGKLPSGFTSEHMETIDLIISRMTAMDEFSTFFTHGHAPRGDNIDSVMRKGVVQYYEVGDPLWMTAMSHFGPKNINTALKIAGGFSNTLRRGVTSMPSFLIPNLVRDGNNAIMFSRAGFKGRIPFAGALHGWADSISRDPTYWEFLANGGGFSSTVHGEVEQSVERFYAREGINYNNVLDTPRKLLDNWDTITSAFEYGTRLGEFRQMRQRGRTAREAALAGREISTDFSMHGASQTMGALRIGVPFFNTRVQGLYKIVREAGATKERNGRMSGMAAALAIRGISLLTIPSLALWAWNNMDEDRREKYQSLPNWVRDMHWVIYVPGRDAPFLIPKPFEVGAMFASVPERMADAAVQGDGEELGPALYWILAEQLNLAPMPQIFNPVYEDLTNENFMEMPVIPPDLQNVDPVEQFKPWSSETATAIGRKLGVSPMRVEHYLRGYFGTLGAQALAAADIITHDEGRFGERPEALLTDYPVVRRFTGRDPQTSTRQQREWYDFMQSVRKAKSTVDKIIEEGRNPAEYLAENPEDRFLFGVARSGGYQEITDAINEIQRAMEKVRVSKTLSGEAKRERLDKLQRQLNALYRRGAEFAEETEQQVAVQ